MDSRPPETKAEVSPNRARAVGWLLALLAAAALAYSPLANLLFSARLLLAVYALAAGSTGGTAPVTQIKIQRQYRGQEREALVYYPPDPAPFRAVLLVAGISEKGCYHPRLIALARTLADHGFLVVTPDIVEFRRFGVPPEAMDEIAMWFLEVPKLEGAAKPMRIGMAGISFSGTLSLMVAARDEIRERVDFVLSIGGYQDLLRCSRYWFASGPRTMSDGYYPTRYYGRWILMLSALDMLEEGRDREELDRALRALLLQGKVQPEPTGLSEQGRRWLSFARMREDETDEALIQSIERHQATYYSRLSPNTAATKVRCPVFLAHGAYDDLIPPEESRALKDSIRNAPSYLLVSPFLTHTHPLEKTFGAGEKIRAAWDMSGFFYRFSQRVR